MICGVIYQTILMWTKRDLKRAQLRMLLKALQEFYDTCEEKGLSTLTLEVNYNPYNMGHKISKTYQSGYGEQKTKNH